MESAAILGGLQAGHVKRNRGELEKEEEDAAVSLEMLKQGYCVFERAVSDYSSTAQSCMRGVHRRNLRRVRKIQRSKGTVPWKTSCMHIGIAYDCYVSKLHAQQGDSKRSRAAYSPISASIALKRTISREQRNTSNVVVPLAVLASRPCQPEQYYRKAPLTHEQQQLRLGELEQQRRAQEEEERRLEEQRYLAERRQQLFTQQYLAQQQQDQRERDLEEQRFLAQQQEQLYRQQQEKDQEELMQHDYSGTSNWRDCDAWQVPHMRPPLVQSQMHGRALSPPGFAHLSMHSSGQRPSLPLPGVGAGLLPMPNQRWGGAGRVNA